MRKPKIKTARKGSNMVLTRALVFIDLFLLFLPSIASNRLFSIAPVYAESDSSFTTSLSTTGVTSVPTMPAGLSAVTVSDSEIDLSWSASTDDLYRIAGYRLFRDGTFLATTTALSYADTGLAASTTYSYTVEAFDGELDFSGQSNPVSATTLATPPPPPPATTTPQSSSIGTSQSGSNLLEIYGVSVVPGGNQATISFSTTLPAQTQVSWGRTVDYELGSLVSPFYGYTHQMVISSLEPGSEYELKIAATDLEGVSVTNQVSFNTPMPAIENPLPNPSDFRAVPFSDHIHLSWNNPNDPRFTGARVVRSDLFFPRDEFDGAPVYEGAGSSFDDTDVVPGKTYYYAVFAEGQNGLFSSGALAEALIPVLGEQPIPANPFANIPTAENVNPQVAALTLSDFDFIQEGEPLAVANDRTVSIDGSENLTIRLAYDKVPEVLKTIAVTIQDPDNQGAVFTFLLRVNADKTYYEATIGPLGQSGDYAMTVIILDYQNMSMKRIGGDLAAVALAAPALDHGSDEVAFMLLLILVLLFAIALLARRRRKKERPQKESSA